MGRVAKEELKMGFVTVALPGNVVTATDEQVKQYGWEDKVEDDGASAAPADTRPGTVSTPATINAA